MNIYVILGLLLIPAIIIQVIWEKKLDKEFIVITNHKKEG